VVEQVKQQMQTRIRVVVAAVALVKMALGFQVLQQVQVRMGMVVVGIMVPVGQEEQQQVKAVLPTI
jgi:hypothetical protein